jgi:opacity protein-like surface antigen
VNGHRLGALSAALLVFSALASAAEPGFYVGVDVGLVESTVDPSDGFQLFLPGFPPSQVLAEFTRVQGTDAGWSASIGYRVNRYVAGEFAYAEFGSIDIEETYDVSEFSPPFPGPVTVLHAASEVTGPAISLLGILPFAGDRFEAFLRAGVLFADQRLNGDLGNARGVELANAQELWLYGAGLGFAATGRWSARLEYLATDRLRANAMTGSMRLERLALGVAYRF